MVRVILVAACCALALPLGAQQTGQPAMPSGKMAMGKMPVGKVATITGTVIDVSCKFGNGLSGAEHQMCSQVCADNGLPLAILGSDGKLYVPATAAMPGKGQNARLRAFAEQKVSVRGKVFAAAGAQVVQIETITASR